MFIRVFKQTVVGDTLPSLHIEPGNQNCGVTDWGDCKRCRLHHTRHRVAVKRFGGSGHTRLLFIGEAPGELENKTGIPFVGTAGRILHQTIKHTHFQFHYCITNTVGCRPVDVVFMDSRDNDKMDEWAVSDKIKELNRSYTNKEFSLSNCVYHEDYEFYDWNREPTKAERELCKPHIDELMESYQPHGVVYLGKIAETYTDPKYLVSVEKLVGDPEARHYKHTKYNEEWVWRHVPTLSMLHPAYIARLEYKLLTVRKEARKLDTFIERFLN